MKNFVFLLLAGIGIACSPRPQSAQDCYPLTPTAVAVVDSPDAEPEFVQFPDQELERFLDSIGGLDTDSLIKAANHYSDSVFRKPSLSNWELHEADFALLKNAIADGVIPVAEALDIFGEGAIDISKLEDEFVNVVHIPFGDSADFNHYAISFGSPLIGSWESRVYFMEGRKVLGSHDIHHRYGLELEHFKDKYGETVIYYKENYTSGSGIWWFNFYFYKYHQGQLIPVLNELENGNLQWGWSIRTYWLESTVLSTEPLTMKMRYYHSFAGERPSDRFLDDSTTIRYAWNPDTRMYEGDYAASKLTRAQILSYYVDEGEVLFIHSHYAILKGLLKKKKWRGFVLEHLNLVKNYYLETDG